MQQTDVAIIGAGIVGLATAYRLQERFRAGQFGIQHYCTIGLNAREANNEALVELRIATYATRHRWNRRTPVLR